MATQWTGKWAGGRTYRGDNGTVWVIERMVRGDRYTIALTVHSEEDALVELALFKRDPVAYKAKLGAPAGHSGEAPVFRETVIADCVASLREKGRVEKHIRDVEHYLQEWRKVFPGRDIRGISLPELTNSLRGKTAKRLRISALKTLTSFLRSTGSLERHQDPTLDLVLPAPRTAMVRKHKGYPMAVVERVYAAVTSQIARDALVLQCKAGMHTTEIQRICRGEAEFEGLVFDSEIAGTVRFVHKKRKVHVQSLDAQAWTAAQRLRGQHFNYGTVERGLEAACKAVGVDLLRPGELRHSFVDWAETVGVLIKPQNAGVPLHEVALAIGHESVRTTRMHYRGRIPPMVKLPIRLFHLEDPTPLLRTGYVMGEKV